MNDVPLSTFREAIQATHGARSEMAARVHVKETFEGQTVWDGEVLVFRLLDHPSASICYCWEVDGRVTAVLSEPPVDSARAAVKAAIVAEHRGE